MGNFTQQIRDCLHLNFAVKPDEVERLLPPGTQLDRRSARGDEWGFFSVRIYRCERIAPAGLGWPALNYPAAELLVHVTDSTNTPAVYLLRKYLPFPSHYILKFFGAFPVRKMDLDFPRNVHPGGTYNWSIEGHGAGKIKASISKEPPARARLTEHFDDVDSMLDFFTRRPVGYFGATSERVRKVKYKGSHGPNLGLEIEEWELGFTGTDLERHSFPEAASCCFFTPETKLDLEGPERVPIAKLVGS